MLPSDRVRLQHMVGAALPELPWPDIIGMRNRLIHTYFDVDIDRVHDTIRLDLPPLIGILKDSIGDQLE